MSSRQYKHPYVSSPEILGEFKCDKCEKRFFRRTCLSRHKREKHSQKPDYSCRNISCTKSFRTTFLRNAHELEQHGIKVIRDGKIKISVPSGGRIRKVRVRQCRIKGCGKTFQSFKNLIKHERQIHNFNIPSMENPRSRGSRLYSHQRIQKEISSELLSSSGALMEEAEFALPDNATSAVQPVLDNREETSSSAHRLQYTPSLETAPTALTSIDHEGLYGENISITGWGGHWDSSENASSTLTKDYDQDHSFSNEVLTFMSDEDLGPNRNTTY